MGERIKDEILDIVDDYSKNEKFGDNNLIYDVFENVVKNKELNNYTHNIFIAPGTSSYEGALADYCPITRNITVYKNSIEKLVDAVQYKNNNFGYYGDTLNSKELCYLSNLLIIQLLLHELVHAEQYKKMGDKSSDSIERKLIISSFKGDEDLTGKEYSELYKLLYDYNPAERMAQIESYETILEVAKSIGIDKISRYIEDGYKRELLRGYDGTISPTAKFLYHRYKMALLREIYDQFNKESDQSLKRRLTLGLNITPDEYESTIMKL